VRILSVRIFSEKGFYEIILIVFKRLLCEKKNEAPLGCLMHPPHCYHTI
jgi:hypothetical protein